MSQMSVEKAKRLLNLFQELRSYWMGLAQGNEEECLLLVDMCEKLRLKWLETHNENQGLHGVVQNLERDLVLSREQMKELKVQLQEARAQIGSLQARCKEAEAERDGMERQVDMVRDLLRTETTGSIPVASMMKYDFLREKPPPSSRSHIRYSEASLGENQIDYDHTEDSIDDEDNVSTLRNGSQWRRSDLHRAKPSRGTKRRSRSVPKAKPSVETVEEEDYNGGRPRKRSKDDHDIRRESGPSEPAVTYGLNPQQAGPAPERRSLNRSFSQPHLAQGQTPTGLTSPPAYNNLILSAKSTADLRSPAAVQSAWTTMQTLPSRPHFFMTKTTLIPEYCDTCNRKMAFGKQCIKCQDCKLTCHLDCKLGARLPCVPLPPGNATTAAKSCRLVELVPSTRPMIPHVILHCVIELERRGALVEQGIYRTQGTQEEVNQVYSKFMLMKGAPDLSLVSHDVVVGVIKKFLGSLKGAVIPLNSLRDFRKPLGITEADYQNKVMRAVMELPAPNRDTLAFIVSHLQRVADLSETNKMPASNLARVIAPTVIALNVAGGNAYEETMHIQAIMQSLLSLSPSFWNEVLTFEGYSLLSPMQTPRTIPAPSTLLGPVTPLGGKNSGSAMKPKSTNKRFFQQPWK